jgi:small-conductance mechanosensitive channel
MFSLLVLAVFLTVNSLVTAQQVANPKDTAEVVIAPISLSEISSAFTKDIKEIKSDFLKKIQIPVVYKSISLIDTTKQQIEKLGKASDNLFERSMPNQFYQSLSRRWLRLTDELLNVEKSVISYSSTLEEIKSALESRDKKWVITAAQPLDIELSEDVDKRINSMFGIIDSVNFILNDSLKASLKLQNSISDIKIFVSSYQEELDQMKKIRLTNMIAERSPAFWGIKFEKDTVGAKIDRGVLLEFEREDGKIFLSLYWQKFVAILVGFILLLWGILWIRKRYPDTYRGSETEQAHRRFLFQHPIAFATILTVFVILIWLPDNTPLLFRKGIAIFIIIQVFYVFQSIVVKPLRWSLYFFFIVYLFSTYNIIIQHGELYNRIYAFVETVVLLGFFLWFILNRKKMAVADKQESVWYYFLNKISPVFFIALTVSLFVNVFGFDNLSQVLNYGVLTSFTLALILGTAYISIKVLVSILFQTGLVDQSLIIHEKKAKLELWFNRALAIVTTAYWLYVSLTNFLLWDGIQELGIRIWNFGYQFGDVAITVGSFLGFFLIVTLSWMVAQIIRIFLQLELLGRFEMPRGVPMAVGSITYYVLMIVGIILALSFVGIDLQNLSLLIGALGVGIGFGLQSTVNNFISGLILAFERPVTVGDIVKIGEHEGMVVSIGLRASIIRQWDGSRIIVPNADFVGSKVLNWTLTKYERRITLTVRTHLDTDPDLVLRLMEEAVENSEYVLLEPEPKTYFHGVREKYLEFALFYWISGDILNAKSEVNLAVQKLLKKEGVRFELPIPVVIEKNRADSL